MTSLFPAETKFAAMNANAKRAQATKSKRYIVVLGMNDLLPLLPNSDANGTKIRIASVNTRSAEKNPFTRSAICSCLNHITLQGYVRQDCLKALLHLPKMIITRENSEM